PIRIFNRKRKAGDNCSFLNIRSCEVWPVLANNGWNAKEICLWPITLCEKMRNLCHAPCSRSRGRCSVGAYLFNSCTQKSTCLNVGGVEIDHPETPPTKAANKFSRANVRTYVLCRYRIVQSFLHVLGFNDQATSVLCHCA